MVKKIVLIDGNNLMFRSYYATAYSGNVMRNSTGFPTNALFGFVNMINKIISEENPEYMAVAFDVGKNFRKKEYDFYKEGRVATPEELKKQMPVARRLLTAMGIKYLELEPYEADDIIGTLVKKTEEDDDYAGLIVSSDKDLLQLISDETEVKLLKQSGFIRYTKEKFIEDYQIEPIRMIDLKALMGDSSDNIPGVKGIGEKTALKLLQEYKSLENIYENIDAIKGKTREKLETDKEMAFISKKIATIYKDVPLDIKLDDLIYKGSNVLALKDIYKKLEFFSLLSKIDAPKKEGSIKYEVIDNMSKIDLDDTVALDIILDNDNYHVGKIMALSITDQNGTYVIAPENAQSVLKEISTKNIITYDAKKLLCVSKISLNIADDLMVLSYIAGFNAKEDLAALALELSVDVPACGGIRKNSEELYSSIAKRSKFIFDYKEKVKEKLTEEELKLYEKIELPLTHVLASMEESGIICDKNILKDMGENLDIKLELITKDVYTLAGEEFNIGSPKQLGEILFEKLGIAGGKKNKTGYKTDVKVLEKLLDKHPIVAKILEYRALAKLKSTYVDGLINYILEDGKIHTIYRQTLTRTGRLSSSDPNLQNIPVREEMGRQIRKAFIPENDVFLSADYSQIELRIMAHLSKCPSLIEAFQNDEDIHTHVAASVFGVPEESVTKNMRRTAKAVIFGIIYGISSFGLGENLHITRKDASDFIDKFHTLFPEVKDYTDKCIKFAKETGSISTLFGRKRVIDEVNNPSYIIRSMGERMAMNTPIQGTSADIMKMAMINVYQRFQKENIQSKILLQVHDEIIVDCLEKELDTIKTIVKEEMENVYKLSVPLKVEIDTGKNWYETK